MHHGLVDSPQPAPGRGRFTAAAAGAAVVVALAGSAVATAYDRAGTASFADTLSIAFVIGAVAVVGSVVTLAVPGNRVGWLLLGGAAAMGAGEALTEAGVHGVVTAPGSVPGAAYLAAIGPGLRGLGWLIALVAVPVVFPDGRLPGPRWRWLAWCAAAAVTCLFLGNVLDPHAQENRLLHWQSPLGLPVRDAGAAAAITAAGIFLLVIAGAGAVAGLITRWRRGGPLVRQQLLLFALAACPPALSCSSSSLPLAAAFHPGPSPWCSCRCPSRSRSRRSTTACTTCAAPPTAPCCGWPCPGPSSPSTPPWSSPPPCSPPIITPGGPPRSQPLSPRCCSSRCAKPCSAPSAGSSTAAGTSPTRYWPGLGERLEAAADIDRLLDAAVTELTTGLGLRDVSVRGLDSAAVTGAVTATGTTIALQAYGATVGWLTYRPPERQLSDAEQRLVRDLARQLGAAVHARLLREDLQRARERLVMAREEERRRLRRDLHDGIGPALAGLTLKTETARALLPPGADGASRRLHDLSEEIRHTVVDVRRLVEGLRPPALDELGLAGACTQAVERLTAEAGLAVSVDAGDDLPALPAAVEVAAYRIVVEAVTNIVRHAMRATATSHSPSPRQRSPSPSPTTASGSPPWSITATAWPSCGSGRKNSAAQ